jgi:hypothetical protein
VSEQARLAERVRRATGATSVELGERLQSLWSGYGELWRITLQRGDTSTPAVAKDVRPGRDDGSRSHRRKLRSYAVEQAFYARYAPRCGAACRVPQGLALRAEAGGFLSVLEDLDAVGFARRCRRPHPSEIAAGLGWLASFHATFLGQTAQDLWKVGTYWHLATRPDELAKMRHAELRRAAGAIDARLSAARFKTLVHGDAKLENACFGLGDTVAFVDFQYVGGGVGVKDVAYFLSCCFSPNECGVLVPRYLDLYFERLRAALGSEGAEVEREWRQLFPLAWVDLYRFLLGWAPGQYDPDPYSDGLVKEVLASLSAP